MDRGQILKEHIRGLMARHRVILRPEVAHPAASGKPDAIQSRVPFIVLDPAEGRCAPERRLLTLEDGGGRLSIRARTRTPPREPYDRASARFATDGAGRPTPVCVVDRQSRTVHALVDLATASILETSDPRDPIGLLVRLLFEEPIEGLVRMDGAPLVGPGVRGRLDRILRVPREPSERVLRQELSLLERFCRSHGAVVTRLARRIEELRNRLARLAGDAPEDVSVIREHELGLLRRLVESRACSELRFGDTEIGGTINPASDGTPSGRSSLEFVLSLASEPFPPTLFLWVPPSGAGRRQPRCLGNGLGMLEEMLQSRSLYGAVDLILNYAETNQVGGREYLGRRAALLEMALGWPPAEADPAPGDGDE